MLHEFARLRTGNAEFTHVRKISTGNIQTSLPKDEVAVFKASMN
jgi:hypothetical protein